MCFAKRRFFVFNYFFEKTGFYRRKNKNNGKSDGQKKKKMTNCSFVCFVFFLRAYVANGGVGTTGRTYTLRRRLRRSSLLKTARVEHFHCTLVVGGRRRRRRDCARTRLAFTRVFFFRRYFVFGRFRDPVKVARVFAFCLTTRNRRLWRWRFIYLYFYCFSFFSLLDLRPTSRSCLRTPSAPGQTVHRAISHARVFPFLTSGRCA